MSLSAISRVRTVIEFDEETYPHLWEAYFDRGNISSDVWDELMRREIYDFWEFVKDRDNGLKVFLIFRTEYVPAKEDFTKLVDSLIQLNQMLSVKENYQLLKNMSKE